MTEQVTVHLKNNGPFQKAVATVTVLRLPRKRVVELEIVPTRGDPLTISIRPQRAFSLVNRIVDALEEGPASTPQPTTTTLKEDTET